MSEKKNLIIILGPTASGKTKLSLNIAKHFQSEIFYCDSRQFYKQLNIGVAKPSKKDITEVKHHFIGFIDIFQHYSISQYENDAIEKLEKYFKSKKNAIMVGGSGLYINAVCKGIDNMPDFEPEIRKNLINKFKNEGIESLRFELKRVDRKYYNEVDLKNHQRILRALEVYYSTGKPFSEFRTNATKKRDFKIIKIGINLDREILYERINNRVDQMIDSGLIDEAKELYKYKNLVALKTIGYKELFMYFEGKTDLQKAIDEIKKNTRNYARKQLSWHRKDDDCKWFLPYEYKKIIEYLNDKV